MLYWVILHTFNPELTGQCGELLWFVRPELGAKFLWSHPSPENIVQMKERNYRIWDVPTFAKQEMNGELILRRLLRYTENTVYKHTHAVYIYPNNILKYTYTLVYIYIYILHIDHSSVFLSSFLLVKRGLIY